MRPAAPTIIRIHPIVFRSSPLTLALTANAMTAPTAIRIRLALIPMVGLCPRSGPAKPRSGGELLGLRKHIADRRQAVRPDRGVGDVEADDRGETLRRF